MSAELTLVPLTISGSPVDVLQVKADSLPDLARQIAITDVPAAQLAANFVQHARNRLSERKEHHADLKSKAHAAWQASIKAEHSDCDPIEEALKILGCKITAYQLECQRIEREETARLQREENERAEREAQQAALDAIDQGATIEEVEIIAVPVPLAVVVPSAPKVAGMSKPIPRYSCEVVDQRLLPEQYKMPNQTMLDGMARTMKTLFNVPGCKLKTEYGSAWTGRK